MTLTLVPDPDDESPGTAVEILPDTSPAIPASRPLHRAPRVRWGPLVYRVRDLADSRPLAVRTVRAVVRTGVQIGHGHSAWGRRVWEAATHAHTRGQIRAAAAAGDPEALGVWVERLNTLKSERTDRLVNMPKAIVGALSLGAAIVAGAAAVALFAGVLVGVVHPAGWTWARYWHLYALGIRFGAVLLVISLQVAFWAAIPTWLYAAWRAGRASEVPGWAMAPAQREEAASIVTPLGVSEALAHLNLAPLNAAIRGGWQIAFDMPPVRVNGRGYQTVFALPMGVTPEMIADKGDVLARNLHRAPMEVWATASKRAGFVDVWVADPGSSERPTPEYPLLHDGSADVFEGVPVGVTQRGDVLDFPIVGANFVAGGQMGQGKSNLCRVVVLGCATDPLVDLWVHVFAGNGDFDAYVPRIARGRYHRGADDETVRAGLHSLRALYEETGRRETRLAEIGAKKLTRGIAKKHHDLRPIVAVFSECHELFGSELPVDEDTPKGPKVGKEATEYATKTLRRARKTGITLGFDTQSSRKDAIPPKIVELVGVNACFSVKTWRSNDGFLGDGSFQAGIRATELRFNVDRGTCLVTGASDEVFEIVKTYFIAVDDETGWDAAADVIARVMGGVHPALGADQAAAEIEAPRDLLGDLDEVLGVDVVRIADVPALLRELAPRWEAYRHLTGKDLRERLAGYGIKVPSTGNRWPLDPLAVREAITRRAAEDLDDRVTSQMGELDP